MPAFFFLILKAPNPFGTAGEILWRPHPFSTAAKTSRLTCRTAYRLFSGAYGKPDRTKNALPAVKREGRFRLSKKSFRKK